LNHGELAAGGLYVRRVMGLGVFNVPKDIGVKNK